MKILWFALLAVSLMVFGCSQDKSATAPAETLNYDVIGEEAPTGYEAAMSELTAVGVTVPDPVATAQVRELLALNADADLRVVDDPTMDEEGRPNFRRIVRHLHDQFLTLRRCLANTEDPQIRRVAYGAHLAMRRGMRALEAHEYRMALQYFRQTNRLLNLAAELCAGGAWLSREYRVVQA